MATTVIVVRHGQTRSNTTGFFMGWSDEDLDGVGYAQARRLSSRLASSPIASVYTSPLRRAVTTAAIIAEPHGVGLEVLDDLTEIHLGDWQGLHGDEIWQRWPDLRRQSLIDPSEITLPNGESFGQVTERTVRAFEKVVSTNQDRHALIVTHDIVVRVLAAYVLGVTNSIYRRLEIGNASVSVVRVANDSRQLVTLNDTSHLEGYVSGLAS